LGTGYRDEAVRRARIAAADFERMLMEAEGRSDPADHRRIVPAKRSEPALPVRPDKTFRDLFDLFMADPSRARVRKTDMVYATLFDMASALWGADRPLRAIDREACRDLLDLLRWLPSNPTKRFPKLTAVQAARMAKAKGLTSTLSPASINGYLNKLRAILNFAVREELLERNPAKGLGVVDPVRSRDKRLPFSTEQLRLIFNTPLYTGCVDDWFGYAVPGPNHPRRGRFWVPLIGLFAGLRLNEACQLDVMDVQVVEGVDCIFVSAGMATPENDKRLKTTSSERYIPIHPTLRQIGFLEFVAERRVTGGRKLFPELGMSSTGYFSDPFSKFFRRFLERAGAARPKTCFHSFRHCYRDALREARIEHDIGLALGGWTSAGGKEGAETAASYGRGYRLATLAEAMKRIEYRGLDLAHLRVSDSDGTD
jgi:integrase